MTVAATTGRQAHRLLLVVLRTLPSRSCWGVNMNMWLSMLGYALLLQCKGLLCVLLVI